MTRIDFLGKSGGSLNENDRDSFLANRDEAPRHTDFREISLNRGREGYRARYVNGKRKGTPKAKTPNFCSEQS
jgi:hypothetical protein